MFAVVKGGKKKKRKGRVRYSDYRLSPCQSSFLSLFELVDGVLRLRPHIAFAKLQVTVGSLWERGIVIFRADGDLQVTPFGNDCIKYQKFAAIDRVSRDGWSERIKFTKKQKDVLGAKEMPQVHRARRA